MAERKSKKQDEYNFEFSYNKNAFDDVIGDPFAPEPIEGHYSKLQKRSDVRVAVNDFDIGKATRNTAQPNIMDFVCDVERLVDAGLTGDVKKIRAFQKTYITEESVEFSTEERVTIEQSLGKLFRRYKLSPVSKYFQTIRQKKESSNGTGNKAARLSL